MHYPVYIFTKEFPTDEIIEKALAPYKDRAAYGNPDISWDYYRIGGRYGGFLKIECKKDDDYYKWMCFTLENKAGRLFRSGFLEYCNKEFEKSIPGYDEVYMFLYCGYRDGYIYADGARIADLINQEEVLGKGYSFIDTSNGEASSREYICAHHGTYVKNQEYSAELKAAMERNKDGYLTVMDLHD